MRLLKKGITVIVFLAFSVTLTITAYAADYGLVVNGNSAVFEKGSEPVNKDGRLLFPLRTVFDAMGNGEGSLDWNADSRMVTLSLRDIKMVLWIDNPVAEINGQKVPILDGVAPIIHNNRTYLPLRFVAEQFGMIVGWNAEYSTASVVDKDVYEAVKILLANNGTDYKKLSMDMQMNVKLDASIGEGRSAYDVSENVDLAASYEIDTDNAFMHMIANSSTLNTEVYILGEDMYIKTDGNWQKRKTSELSSSLGANPLNASSFLDIADVEKITESLESYDPYLTFGLSKNEAGDNVTTGIMFLPPELLDSVLGSVIGAVDQIGDITMNLSPISVKFVYSKDSDALKSADMSFNMDMTIDVLGQKIPVSASYNVKVKNINYKPDFESKVPEEVIKKAAA